MLFRKLNQVGPCIRIWVQNIDVANAWGGRWLAIANDATETCDGPAAFTLTTQDPGFNILDPLHLSKILF